jgi:hypothetical protein
MADNDDDDSDSDEWGMEELVIPDGSVGGNPNIGAVDAREGDGEGDDDDDDDWASKIISTPADEAGERGAGQKEVVANQSTASSSSLSSLSPGEPMIIVDITRMDPNIHSRFDRSSVNDAGGASAIRKRVEGDYDRYAGDAGLLADGTVIPCGSSVWRDALVQLRDDRPGHYFVPVFPPKSTTKL